MAAGVDADFEAAYAKGRLKRGLALVVATGLAAIVSLLLFLQLEPPKYVARWDEYPVRVTDDGRFLYVTVSGRNCDDSVLFEIVQSKDQVKLTAVVTQHLLRRCNADGVPRSFSVRLGKPLGDRPVLDGRCTHDESEALVTEDCPAQPVVPEMVG